MHFDLWSPTTFHFLINKVEHVNKQSTELLFSFKLNNIFSISSLAVLAAVIYENPILTDEFLAGHIRFLLLKLQPSHVLIQYEISLKLHSKNG